MTVLAAADVGRQVPDPFSQTIPSAGLGVGSRGGGGMNGFGEFFGSGRRWQMRRRSVSHPQIGRKVLGGGHDVGLVDKGAIALREQLFYTLGG